ncbi:MAG TPA: imidazole glycerol phosphate synthase subunit HisF [Clostridia bacterium]|jgi:imidazoleglycerol phosphate synthase cyclase subunit|nr:imidazole glycerol phosphate synthase subunit HisF [Clostridia bacterium]
MKTNKIIPCLDIKDGIVVKGVKFVDIKDAGYPVSLAKEYCRQGADELVMLYISAATENKTKMYDTIKEVVNSISIPLTVGGGISSLEDAKKLFELGVSKVSINSAAVKNPRLISEISKAYGSDKVVVAIDAHTSKEGNYTVLISGGKVDTGIDVIEWAKKVESLGAGSILLTSMDADGTKDGYDIEMTKALVDNVSVPVIASGGCGKLEHFLDAFKKAGSSGALAASLFHFGELTVTEVKDYLKKNLT